jgi:nitrogen fixation protein NifB
VADQIVSLASIARGRLQRQGGASPSAPAGGDCASGSCAAPPAGAAADGAAGPAPASGSAADHPCYSAEAHRYFARLHLPVAPACNLQCHYCNRKYDCANESRPGVTSDRLTPEQAIRRARAMAAEMPELQVIGIAGPGDPLANPERTFATIEGVREALPDLTLCLSTNGLALPDHVETIARLGVGHVTVTVNMVDPAVGEGIYPWIFYQHKRRRGREASDILHERQMEGIERLAAAGVLIKVNTVLIPGVNDAHLPRVHEAVTARGAAIHNVMPLIVDPAHGTHYGNTGQRAPTAPEVEAVRAGLGASASLMVHCRQCRADAAGLLGADKPAGAFDAAEAIDDRAGLAKREAYRGWVAEERADLARAKEEAELVAKAGPAPALIAVASRGGGRVNAHFGRSESFAVYRADETGIALAGIRRVDRYCAGGGDDARMAAIVRALEGVDAVLCAKIGKRPRRDLEAAGFAVDEAHAGERIETAIAAHLATRAEPARPVAGRIA